MAICWKNDIHAEAIFTFAHNEQEIAQRSFKLDVTESEERVIYNLIQSMFDINSVDELELMSDIIKVSFCLSDGTRYPQKKLTEKEEAQLWKLPFMQAFLARNGKYYFDEEQRDEVESSIKGLLDCWREEIC